MAPSPPANLNDDEALVKEVKHDFQNADISPKLKALLVIAGLVRKGASTLLLKMFRRRVRSALPTWRSTIRCSLRPHSACTTAMSMARARRNRGMKPGTVNVAGGLLAMATSQSASNI